MEPKTIATAIAAGRFAIGAALLAAPGAVASRWLGEISERPGAQVAISGVGARDLVVGAGTAWSLQGRKRPVRPWLLAGMVADVADVAAMLRFREGLSAPSLIGTGALAGAAAVASAWLLTELD